MDVKKFSVYVPVSDEQIVDYALGTPEQIAEAQARIDRDAEVMRRYWRRLPFYVRWWRELRWRLP